MSDDKDDELSEDIESNPAADMLGGCGDM